MANRFLNTMVFRFENFTGGTNSDLDYDITQDGYAWKAGHFAYVHKDCGNDSDGNPIIATVDYEMRESGAAASGNKVIVPQGSPGNFRWHRVRLGIVEEYPPNAYEGIVVLAEVV